MMFRFVLRVLLLGFLSAVIASAQTLADRLGYPPGTKLIIVHADDLGETHAVNAATIKAKLSELRTAIAAAPPAR